MASETIADIVAEMRELADDIEAGNAVVGQTVWRNYADRIEAAAKRDAAIHAMTCEANERLREHLEIALEDNKRTVGNSAAIREALVQIVALAKQDQPRFAIISTAETALAAPPRNCDVYPCVAEARNAFICEQCEHPCGDCTVCDDDYALCRPCGIKWLFAPAKKGGEE